jgi:hypothetical protein
LDAEAWDETPTLDMILGPNSTLYLTEFFRPTLDIGSEYALLTLQMLAGLLIQSRMN